MPSFIMAILRLLPESGEARLIISGGFYVYRQ